MYNAAHQNKRDQLTPLKQNNHILLSQSQQMENIKALRGFGRDRICSNAVPLCCLTPFSCSRCCITAECVFVERKDNAKEDKRLIFLSLGKKIHLKQKKISPYPPPQHYDHDSAWLFIIENLFFYISYYAKQSHLIFAVYRYSSLPLGDYCGATGHQVPWL